jgi:hypothetical protein
MSIVTTSFKSSQLPATTTRVNSRGYLASTRVRGLWRHPLLAGAAYGLVVYVVVNFVVLPLSAFAVRPFQVNAAFFNLIFAHVVCVGWPIALAANDSARVPTVPRPGRV